MNFDADSGERTFFDSWIFPGDDWLKCLCQRDGGVKCFSGKNEGCQEGFWRVMSDTAITVENVSKIYKLYNKPGDRVRDAFGLSKKKRYKEYYALNDVSFSVNRGETVGIIGTNGSGKSTVLKIITGVLSPSSGKVTVGSRISALLELGAGFNSEYTGLENIYLNGTMIGFTKEEIDARLQTILDFADIGEFINQPVKTYSSGMFVRLAFAISINIDPDILIVDEALSVGDVFFQAKCYHKFEEFKNNKKTILFVSHDLSSIIKYCDRVVLLNRGVKMAEGDPKEIVDMYKKLLVQEHDAVMDMAAAGAKQKVSEPDSGKKWKEYFSINSNHQSYGNNEAEIVDFGIFSADGGIGGAVEKGDVCTIKMKVRFNSEVENPIFALTIKDLKGTEITGTNSFLEGMPEKTYKKGEECTVSFTQEINLQGGDYLLSFGCTGFKMNEFTVYHRLYDVINLNVIAKKNSVGYYDMNSKVEIESAE